VRVHGARGAPAHTARRRVTPPTRWWCRAPCSQAACAAAATATASCSLCVEQCFGPIHRICGTAALACACVFRQSHGRAHRLLASSLMLL
jgi:hypothetical protein